MEKSLNCHMVTAIVKKAIHDLKSDPERTVRNLIDMALHFTDSRFQQEFYTSAQRLLTNEKSGYYTWVKETITHVNEETLLTFCMNLGYNGLYEGSKKIRTTEENEHYNIPCTISLAVAKGKLSDHHHKTIEQGEKLGIHIWYLFSDHGIHECLTLAQKHPDSSFIIVCGSSEESLEGLDQAENIRNIAFITPFDEDADIICDMLRISGILFGLYYTYSDKDIDSIESGELLSDMEQLHPAIAVLNPQFPCQEELRSRVHKWVTKARTEQQLKTIPWEMYDDTLLIDRVVSEQPIWVGFDQYGQLNTDQGIDRTKELNIFLNDLSTILKQAFPKPKGAD